MTKKAMLWGGVRSPEQDLGKGPRGGGASPWGGAWETHLYRKSQTGGSTWYGDSRLIMGLVTQ